MITYKYTAQGVDGNKITGIVEAVDEYSAVSRVKQTYPIVIKLEEVKQKDETKWYNKDITPRKVDGKAMAVMCNQFSTILSSGIDISSCLEMIGKQTQDKRLKKMLLESSKDVAQGTALATAMEKNMPYLPVTFIETIRAGEISGNLEESFQTMQTYFERNYSLKQKVKSALSYPIFVVCVAVVVVIVVMVKVVPTLTSVFESLGGDLPFITRLLINISDFFSKWWLLILGIIIVAFIIFKVWKNTDSGRIQWAKFQLSNPIGGKIATNSACADFANTMAALLQSGVNVTEALRITSKILENALLSQETQKLSEKVQVGNKLGDSMRNAQCYPETLTEMTAIGENTGEIEKTLMMIGTYYANETTYAINSAIAKLEPTLLICLAIFAGFIVLAIYMPMFTMYNLM